MMSPVERDILSYINIHITSVSLHRVTDMLLYFLLTAKYMVFDCMMWIAIVRCVMK